MSLERNEVYGKCSLVCGVIFDDVHLIIGTNRSGETIRVEIQPLGHAKAPFVFHLTTQIQVAFHNQKAIANSRQTLVLVSLSSHSSFVIEKHHLRAFDFHRAMQHSCFLHSERTIHECSSRRERTIEMTKVLVSYFSIAAGEFTWKCFRTDSINTHREVTVGDGCISRFDTPQRFAGRD